MPQRERQKGQDPDRIEKRELVVLRRLTLEEERKKQGRAECVTLRISVRQRIGDSGVSEIR